MTRKESLPSVINTDAYFNKKIDMVNFVIQYQKNYSKDNFNFLMGFILGDMCFETDVAHFPRSAAQLFSKFEIFNENWDTYLEFAKILERYSFLEGNVLEVAAGAYPILAEIIAPKIQTKKGSLTVYEPDLVFTNISGVNFLKKKFTLDTDVSKYSTIVGMWTCEATIPIIEQALEHNKNLLIACCGCDHSNDKYPRYNFGEYWADDLAVMLKDDYGDEIDILRWPKQLGIKKPIIARTRRK